MLNSTGHIAKLLIFTPTYANYLTVSAFVAEQTMAQARPYSLHLRGGDAGGPAGVYMHPPMFGAIYII